MKEMLAAFAEDMRQHEKSEKTIKDYCYNVQRFADYVEESRGYAFGLPVLENQVRDYLSHLLNIEKKQPATANVRMAAIQSFVNFCNRHYGSPIIKVPRKKVVEDHSVEILTKQELNRLKDCFERSGNKLHYAIFMLMIYSGIRETELINLELEDVIITDRKQYIVIKNGKGNKQRQVKLHVRVRQPLLDYLKIRPNTGSTKFFIGNRGTLSSSSIYKLVRRYAEKAGISRNVYPHMLRHQCFTEQAKHCHTAQDLKNLADNAGHSSVELTMKYYVANDREGMDTLVDSME